MLGGGGRKLPSCIAFVGADIELPWIGPYELAVLGVLKMKKRLIWHIFRVIDINVTYFHISNMIPNEIMF